jgi:uncharacterized protein (TIGR00288 family)
MAEEPLIAVFVDFENLALGVRDMKGGAFKVDLILKRLLEKGRIVYKRAYCDWKNYRDQVEDFHKQGIALVDIPRSKMSGKNSADIHMVVDALDLCYSKDHIDIFALLTGDSDFSPLVSKLKENNKRVVGCGVKNSTSNLLIANCDEFIYYDDLARALEKSKAKPRAQRGKKASAESGPAKKDGKKAAGSDKEKAADRDASGERKPEAMDRLLEILESLSLDYDPIWGSMIKQTLRRVYPGFNEGYMGYRNFAELLKHAESEGYISLEYDDSRGNYKVRLLDY